MPELSPAYTEMRDTLLAVTPETAGMQPTDVLPHVYGTLIDIGFEVLYSVAAFADGTTSAYDSTGGAVGHLGDLGDMAMMNRALLREVEAHLDQFEPVESSPLPAFGRVRITVLTYDGLRGIELDGTPLLKGQHPLSKVFSAAMAIVESARQVAAQKQQEAASPPSPGKLN
jgi:hypothetical protein